MTEFNYDDILKIEVADYIFSFIASELGIVVLQSQASDDVYAVWIYDQEIKGTEPKEYKSQQFTGIAKSKRGAIIQVFRGIRALQDIDVSIKLLPYDKQVKLVKAQLGDNFLDE